MKKVIVLATSLAFLFTVSCNPLNVINRLQWQTIESPRGFSVTIPKGYKIKVTDSGTVIAYKPADKDNAAFFKTGIVSLKGANSDDMAEEIIEDIKEINPDASLGSSRDTKYGKVYKINSIGKAGMLLIAQSGNNAFASGLACTNKKNLSLMVKTVKSFKFRPDLIDTSKLGGIIVMTDWTEPNEKAFSMKIPHGWTTKGGVVRPYIDAATDLTISKGNMGVYVSAPHVPIYSEPNNVSAMAGFTEGSHYNPGGAPTDMIIKSWHDAASYLTDIYGPEKGVGIDAHDRQDLADKYPKVVLNRNVSAAEGSYTKNGIENKVVVLTVEVGMDPSWLWTVQLLHYWAPPNKIKTVEKIIDAMGKSFKINQTWAAEEARQIQIRSQIMSQTADEIRETMNSSFEMRSESMDRISHNFSNAILGVNDVYDEQTGETFSVPNDSNYYWKKGDEIYGTDTYEHPYPDPDFRELKVLP